MGSGTFSEILDHRHRHTHATSYYSVLLCLALNVVLGEGTVNVKASAVPLSPVSCVIFRK